jgi:hypothetical protein
VLLETAIDGSGSSSNSDHIKVLSNKRIYDEVYSLADGSPIADKQYSFYSVEYGEVSEKKILKICRDKFFAQDDKIGRDDNKQRALQFNEEKVSKVGQAFDVIPEIKIVTPDPEDGSNFDDQDDDDGLWSGWSGGDNDAHGENGVANSTEESTSQSGTEIRKMADMEEKGAQSDDALSLRQDTQNSSSDDDVNLMKSDLADAQNLHKNSSISQNTLQSGHQSNGLGPESFIVANSQKDTLIPGNDPISVFLSPNDAKKVIEQINSQYRCYYCDYETKYDEAYDKHVVLTHPGRPAYPNKADIEKLGLKAQGKSWEI